MRLLLGTMALLLAATAAIAATATNGAPAARSTSVTEMLQNRQAHQLRARLVKEGRLDEVRQLDEEQLRRQQLHTGQTLNKINAGLAREDAVGETVNRDGIVLFCAPEKSPVSKIKSDLDPGDTTAGKSLN